MRIKVLKIFFASGGIFLSFPFLHASEVIEETNTKVIVREHPKTGRPYVSIVAKDSVAAEERSNLGQPYKRPDYRLLDPKVKPGEIVYEGLSSDRKKVYILAVSLAALGTAGGTVAAAAVPAATAAGAGGGAGAYGVAGGAVAAGSLSAALTSAKSDPRKDNFQQTSQARLSQPISTKKDK